MTEAIGRAQRDALGLLLAGYTPEEVEDILTNDWCTGPPECDRWHVCERHAVLRLTALSDPTNVLMQEVSNDGTADSARSR